LTINLKANYKKANYYTTTLFCPFDKAIKLYLTTRWKIVIKTKFFLTLTTPPQLKWETNQNIKQRGFKIMVGVWNVKNQSIKGSED